MEKKYDEILPSLEPRHNHLLPDKNLEVYEPNLRLFWYWIYERHQIYVRRFVEKKPSPWTKDEILRDYKFTNVYRELDRNSVWLRKNIINTKDRTFKSKLFALISFRLFNNVETFEETGIQWYEDFDAVVFEAKLKKIVERGLNPFTDAYLVNSMAYAGMKKYIAYAAHVIPFVHSQIPAFMKTILTAKEPEEIVKHFQIIKGVSHFVSYELYCDLDYFNPAMMKFDQNDFVNVGPGALTGARLIFPTKGKNFSTAREVIYHLRDNQKKYLKQFGFADFPFLQNKYGVLTLREIEHSLCEFQKYWKMIQKIGKQRKKFAPVTSIK